MLKCKRLTDARLRMLKKQTEVVAEIVEDLPEQKVVVLGHSYGGPIAAYSSLLSTKVKSVIMLAPAIDPENEKVFWIAKVAKWKLTKWIVPGAMGDAGDEKFTHVAELEKLKEGLSIDLEYLVDEKMQQKALADTANQKPTDSLSSKGSDSPSEGDASKVQSLSQKYSDARVIVIRNYLDSIYSETAIKTVKRDSLNPKNTGATPTFSRPFGKWAMGSVAFHSGHWSQYEAYQSHLV